MKNNNDYEICPLARVAEPNGVIKIENDIVDYVIINGKPIFETTKTTKLDNDLVKKISQDLLRMVTGDAYKTVKA